MKNEVLNLNINLNLKDQIKISDKPYMTDRF